MMPEIPIFSVISTAFVLHGVIIVDLGPIKKASIDATISLDSFETSSEQENNHVNLALYSLLNSPVV